MGNQLGMRAVVNSGANLPNNGALTPLTLVNPDGSAASTVTPQTKPADSVASTVGTLVTDFNGLLAVLKTAGVLK